MSAADWAVLLVAATAAGWVDAVVGGGGLILLPALFLVAPQLTPQAALATNKLSAIFGTGAAVITFARRIPLQWKVLAPAALVAAVCAAAGAAAVSLIDPDVFIPLVMVVLVSVAVFVTARPTLGTAPAHKPSVTRMVAVIVGAAAVIGFYDGILGPGTGTFFIIVFAAMLGSEFVTSAAMAKVLNFGSNLGALVLFALGGHVWWTLGLAMAVCNVAGSVLGSRTALRRGAGFVRVVLLVVVTAMVIRLGIQQFG
ncbi:TSUP family transporter [Rhodococcus artemisiae]|uniref:Probable membrane transporter protein n=1 Tax=Rhodococcus artemisiae TaxID=714159 RepID=A0ABU7LLU8_9NOCA|nr:TSUP family transporter [Rhodococcus artemisiae]MEE2061887.1 TSUP family transporter [Rhodococcus artemisiae]